MVPENLLEKNLAELRAMAQALGVKNVGKYRKNELAQMLAGQSEAPAPKKRGRPTKGASAAKTPSAADERQVADAAAEQAPEAEVQPVAPAQEKPKAKPGNKAQNGRKRKPSPKKTAGEPKAAEEKPAATEAKSEAENAAAAGPAEEKSAEPVREAPKGDGKEENGDKGEPRRRDGNRAQNNRYQKGYTRHYGNSANNQNASERRYSGPNTPYSGQSNQEPKSYRPAVPPNPATPAGEEEKPYYNHR